MSTDLDQLAIDAFIYGYPLVEGVAGMQHLVSGPITPTSAPVNTFGLARTLVTPADARAGGVVSPNTDTLYSFAIVDVGQEPLVLRLPEVHDRYYIFQLFDAWTNNFAYVGRRTVGDAAGDTLLIGPDWTGEPPAGMRVIQAPTTLFGIAGRFLVTGSDDLEAVHQLQDGVQLIPLSAYPTPISASSRTFGDWPLVQPDPATPKEFQFWEALRLWMRTYPPHPDDIAYQQQFAPLGLLDEENPYLDADPALAKTLQAAQQTALQALDDQAAVVFPERNGWQAAREEFNYNTHFLEFGTLTSDDWMITDPARARLIRAIAARQAIWGNHAYEAFYPATFVDADGDALTGELRYVLHFGQPPPVDGFWSVTMYDSPSFFPVDNPLSRYSIGNNTEGLQTNADGSLEIVIQHDSPGEGNEANWLPAPEGVFRPMLRMYLARPAVFDDTQWRLPPIQKAP